MAGESSIAWVQFAGSPLQPVTNSRYLRGSPLPGLHQHGGGSSGGSLAALEVHATTTIELLARENTGEDSDSKNQ